jgi:hypothetical protein
VCRELRKLIRAYSSIRQTDRSDQAGQTDRQTDRQTDTTDRNQRILNNVTNRASVCA